MIALPWCHHMHCIHLAATSLTREPATLQHALHMAGKVPDINVCASCNARHTLSATCNILEVYPTFAYPSTHISVLDLNYDYGSREILRGTGMEGMSELERHRSPGKKSLPTNMQNKTRSSITRSTSKRCKPVACSSSCR